jgi:MoxR-like ATPase
MGECQVTVGLKTYAMPKLFMVLATQNPIEQEGTYNLPEAQLDRFLMHVRIDYPTREEELAILELDSNQQLVAPQPPVEVFSQQQLFKVREDVAKLYLDTKLNNYIVDLVQASRKPEAYDEGLKRWCRIGASPRATIALARCARARAWLDGDEFVAPHHIQAVAPDVLRHRILLTFEGEAEGVTSDDYIKRLLEVVAVP